MRLYSCGQAWKTDLMMALNQHQLWSGLAKLRKQCCDWMAPGIEYQEAGVLIQVVI